MLAIALPIVLSNATIPILGAVDTGVIGQLGEAAPIRAVGVGAVILTSIYWVFGFLRMGTSGLVAQAHGAGDGTETGAHLIRALVIAAVAGLSLILLHPLLFGAAFRLAPASAEVETLAGRYLAIRIWGAPATIALYAITGWLIAMERTRHVLVLQLLQNGLNIVLDLGFVLGLGHGVGGIAAATLIAEFSGLALGLWFCREALMAATGRAGLFARHRLMRLLRVNSDIMIRSVLLQASFTSFIFLSAGEGDVTLAANQVLLQFLQITAFGLDGFAFAAESLVGQAAGARRPAALRRAAGAVQPVGRGRSGTSGAGLSGRGPVDHRPSDHRHRGPRRGPALPALARRRAADRDCKLDAGRDLHRCHPDRADAPRHDRDGLRLCHGAADPADCLWQSRALGGADGAEPDPRADHGAVLPRGGSGGALVQTHFASGGRLISTASALCPVSSPNFVPRS